MDATFLLCIDMMFEWSRIEISVDQAIYFWFIDE